MFDLQHNTIRRRTEKNEKWNSAADGADEFDSICMHIQNGGKIW